MSDSSAISQRWLSPRQRFTVAVAGVMLAGLLATAAVLRPNPAGLGTHRQLGLPPCTFQVIFQWRCPSCGMTTSWAHFVRGRWRVAWRTNAGGMLLALSSAIGAPWLIGSAARGRWLLVRPNDWGLLVICFVILVVTLGQWLIRIASELGR